MQLCENCNERTATVHLTEIVNKQKTELHLCEECAKEQGYSVQSPHFSTAELLGELVAEPKSPREGIPDITCPACGITYAEFRASGRLGCANDYTLFKGAMLPLLEKMHGHTQHVGKIPAALDDRVETEKQLLVLRQKLQRSIQREEYERAAEIRDKIFEMENAAGD